MRRRLAHLTVAVLATAVVGIAGATPAMAKVPPLTIELAPGSPTAGEPFEIRVRFWDDAAHTIASRWPDMPVFDDFLWIVPLEPVDADPVSVALRRERRGVFGASVRLASPGRWSLCFWSAAPCGKSGTGPAYAMPAGSEILVVAAPDPAESPTGAAPSRAAVDSGSPGGRGGTPAPVAAAAALAVVLAGAFGVHRSRRR
jgi:hypothetical protein